ncbi:MAG TPA: hypothetical protein VNL77_15745, partial [Roseiflexaceae bacterium]|nr:hypothetical protein [Roseiflexaceae bacterium]
MKWFYLLFLAAAETLPAILVLTLFGMGDAWPPLLAVALAGAGADWLAGRALAPRTQRYVLLAAGTLLALWAAKGLAGGGYSPLGGWAETAALVRLDHPANGRAYLGLLGVLYVFWRGTNLAAHDSYTLRAWFTRTAVALLVGVAVGVAGRGDPSLVAQVAAEVLAFFAAGLGALALAGALEAAGPRG